MLYVVPTFGWTTHTDAQGKQTRWRHGGGLRVYLDRPWNASGYGEMLAVVLPKAGFAGDPNTEPAGKPYKKFVTQWGNDPIWESSSRHRPDAEGRELSAGADHARSDRRVAAAVRAADRSRPAAGAVRHDQPAESVGDAVRRRDARRRRPARRRLDAERRLWYCDLDINFGASYFPFVRLALARYQPVSVHGAALSNIVLADFMSLAPDRWLTVSRAADITIRNVTVFGHSYSDSSGRREAAQAPSSVGFPVTPESSRSRSSSTPSSRSGSSGWIADRGEDFGWVKESGATATEDGDIVVRPGRPQSRRFRHVRPAVRRSPADSDRC